MTCLYPICQKNKIIEKYILSLTQLYKTDF